MEGLVGGQSVLAFDWFIFYLIAGTTMINGTLKGTGFTSLNVQVPGTIVPLNSCDNLTGTKHLVPVIRLFDENG